MRTRIFERPMIVLIAIFLLQACVAVKGYEKMYLSDEEMQLKSRAIEEFEIDVETYREGASGANGGKTGGGCGCD